MPGDGSSRKAHHPKGGVDAAVSWVEKSGSLALSVGRELKFPSQFTGYKWLISPHLALPEACVLGT